MNNNNITYSKLSLWIFSILFSSTAFAAEPNLINDSGFELGTPQAGKMFTDNHNAPISNGSPWMRTVGTCDHWAGGPRDRTLPPGPIGVWAGLANGLPAVPNKGKSFVACGSWYPPGERIKQEISNATIGKKYTLSFYYANAGVEGQTPVGKQSWAKAGMWVNDKLIGSTPKIHYAGAGKQKWKKASFRFKPTASNFTFTAGLHSSSKESIYNYIAFDGMSVEVEKPVCWAIDDTTSNLYTFLPNISDPVAPIITPLILGKDKYNDDVVNGGEGITYRPSTNRIYIWPNTRLDNAAGETQQRDVMFIINPDDGTVEHKVFPPNGDDKYHVESAVFTQSSSGVEQLWVIMEILEPWDEQDENNNLKNERYLTRLDPDTGKRLEEIGPLYSDNDNPINSKLNYGRDTGGLAVDPETKQFVITIDSGSKRGLYPIDIADGKVSSGVLFTNTGNSEADAEALGLALDNNFYTESDEIGKQFRDRFIWQINKKTGGLTKATGKIPGIGDIEGIECNGDLVVIADSHNITGSVYFDENKNSLLDGNDAGIENIKVTLYKDNNNDGAIDNDDTLLASQETNNNGVYNFTKIRDGNYLVKVDSGLPPLMAVNGINPLNITIDKSGASDQNFPVIKVSCTALTGEINASLQIKNNKKIFLATTTLSPIEGHLKSYTTGDNGIITAAIANFGDAANKMDEKKRKNKLYSTGKSSNKIKFDTLDADAFAVHDNPNVSTIKKYTINPSESYPTYIGHRKKNSFLGAISHNTMALVGQDMNVMQYLSDSTYRSYNTDVVSKRINLKKRVLLSSNDGFIYSIYQRSGGLGWGWIPRTLVKELKDYRTFSSDHFMHGTTDVLDLKSSATYNSYVIGSYKKGLGQYVLKLDSSSDLNGVVWDIDHEVDNTKVYTAPNHGQRAYFSDKNGKVYSVYTITQGTSSKLHIRSLADTSTTYLISLNFIATSSPYIMMDYARNNAPAKKTLYLGDSNGNIHSVPLLAVDNTLATDSAIATEINKGAVAALGSSNTSPVTYIGASRSMNRAYYLRAQSEDRLTVFKYKSSDTSWNRQWSTIVGGSAGKWSGGTLVADPSITALPAGATISDNATIAANSIILPVTHAPTGNRCYGTAYYYLYSLTNGYFPSTVFTKSSDKSAINSIISVGLGNAKTLQLSDSATADKLLGMGISEQKTNGQTGVNTTIYINDTVTTGIRSWRELRK